MSRKLTASDRKALIRLASEMEKGSEERRSILSAVRWGAMSGKDKDIEKIFRKEITSAIRKIQSNQKDKSKIELQTDAGFSGNSEPKFRVFTYFTVNIADYLEKGPSGPSWLVKKVDEWMGKLKEEMQDDWEDEGNTGAAPESYFAKSLREEFRELIHFSLEVVYFHPESKAFEGRKKKGEAGLFVEGEIESNGYRIWGDHQVANWYSFPADDLRKLEGALRKGLKNAIAGMS